MFVNFLALMHR